MIIRWRRDPGSNRRCAMTSQVFARRPPTQHDRLSSALFLRKVKNPRLVVEYTSPVDEVWNTLTAVLNFGVLKRIQTPHSLLNFILGFLSR